MSVRNSALLGDPHKDMLETGPLERLTALAMSAFDAPGALIGLLDGDHVVVRSSASCGQSRMARAGSLTNLIVAAGADTAFVVEDAKEDPRTRDHFCVSGPLGVRFVAGMAFCDPRKKLVGALTVLDNRPRGPLTEREEETLRLLARMAGDVMAQISASRDQAERLQTLELVEEMSGVGHWHVDVVDMKVAWSDEVYRIHGVTREDFTPDIHAAFDFYHPDDQPRIRELCEAAAETGEGFRTKLRIVRRDGEERRVLIQSRTEKDETDHVTSLFGVFQDVTEQQRLLDKARREESRYRLLAENVDDVITRVKFDGSSKYISPAIKQLLGWTLEDMSGQSTDYVHPEDRHQVLKAIQTAATTGEPTRLEHRAIHREGHTVWVECTFKALKDAEGRIGDVVVVIRDMSRRKMLEAQVIEARDRAEKAAAAKSEFLANMSHELRTPLTSVIGFSGLLQGSSALPAQERLYVDRIATASEALLGVINDILDYSKLEARAIEMDPQPFSVQMLAEGAAAILESQCSAKGLNLKVQIDPATPSILMGDEARLRQVTLNFLSNAVKFTAQGGVTLCVGGRAEADGRWRLRVAVTDTGIGIPPEKIDQLFERFTQADASTTRVYGGTGLGLAISRRLIRLMGGEIGVESRPGEGATFWFETPLSEGEALDHDAVRAAGSEAMSGRVLMADDAPANRELVTTLLTGLGLTVDAVCDGAEAVQALQRRDYDLVLMDVHMPVMDGLTATREIRRMQGGGPRTPVLALTANVQAEQVARCLEAGMDGHLAKPVQIPELIGALSYWLTPDEDEPRAVIG
jgi:PAS domain S-box-containing protein